MKIAMDYILDYILIHINAHISLYIQMVCNENSFVIKKDLHDINLNKLFVGAKRHN